MVYNCFILARRVKCNNQRDEAILLLCVPLYNLSFCLVKPCCTQHSPLMLLKFLCYNVSWKLMIMPMFIGWEDKSAKEVKEEAQEEVEATPEIERLDEAILEEEG